MLAVDAFSLAIVLAAIAIGKGEYVMRHQICARDSVLPRSLSLLVGLFATLASVHFCFAEQSQTPIANLIRELDGSDLQSRREAAWQLAEVDWESHRHEAESAVRALGKAVADRDPQVANGALQALGQLGPAARPALAAIWEEAESRDPQRRYRASFALGRVLEPDDPGIGPGLREGTVELRESVARAIGWMPTGSAAWAEELAELLADDSQEVATAAQESIRMMKTEAVPALIALLKRPSSSALAIQRTAETLGDLGRDAEAASNVLLLAARNQDPAVRAAAVEALGKVESVAQGTDRAIQLAMRDDDAIVRQAAIRAVVRRPASSTGDFLDELTACLNTDPQTAALAGFALGRAGSSAIPAVGNILRGMTADNQSAVLDALSRLGVEVIAPVMRLVRRDELPSELATEIIAGIGMPAAASIRPALASASPQERAVAARVLGRLRLETDAVAGLLDDREPTVRRAALQGLASAQSVDDRVRDLIKQRMADRDASVRSSALDALVKLSTDRAETARIVLTGLEDTNPEVRRQAAANLSQFDEIPPSAIEPLRSALADEKATVRLAAAQALARAGPAARPAIPALLSATEDTDPTVVAAAATALGSIADPETVARVIALTEHADRTVQRHAVEALGAWGSGASQARPRLEALVTAESPELRMAAIDALVRVIPASDETRMQPLVRALSDSDWSVRRKVTETIGSLGPDGKAAVPDLLIMLLEQQGEAEPIMNALRQIDAAPPESVPLLIRLLEDTEGDRRTRFYALHLLRKIGPAASEALPALEQMREKADGRLQDFLDRAIRDIRDE